MDTLKLSTRSCSSSLSIISVTEPPNSHSLEERLVCALLQLLSG